MGPKREIFLKILFFFSFIVLKARGSSLTCCFEILRNRSVSYHLSEPAGENCTPTWSDMEVVVVDEHGNTDESKVVYLGPKKLILNGNMEGKVQQVTYRKDCLHIGLTFTAECHDPCVPLDALTTVPALYDGTTEPTGRDQGIYIIFGIIIFIIIIIIIIITVRSLKKKMNFWREVPKDEPSNSPSTVLDMRALRTE